MAFTQNELDLIVNPALDRISADNVSFTNQSGRAYSIANRYYGLTRDTLLRSYEWSFGQKRATLYAIQTLEVDRFPMPSLWVAGDYITGVTSGQRAKVLVANSEVSYEIGGTSGSFTDGETIINSDLYGVTFNGVAVSYDNLDTSVEETVVWFDDADVDAVVCGTGYPDVETAVPGHEWSYQYNLPDDCIRLVRVFEDDGTDGADYRFHIEGDRIMTNYSTMNIRYVYQVTDPALFTDLFREVLTLRMAMKLVNPLAGTASDAFKQELRNDLKYQEMHARVVDAQENNTSGRVDWLLSRYANEQPPSD